MDSRSCFGHLLLLISLASFLVNCYSSTSHDDLKTYIVYTGNTLYDETSSLLHYKSLLQQVADHSNQVPKPVLQHYKRSFSGFVANLSKEEANIMAGLDGVVSVFPNEKRHLLTTKSWDFFGFPQKVERKNYESDVIIGVIDSGIWPESGSFNDKGFSPPPTKWKGTCKAYNFSCNNKLIGARYYISFFDELSEQDFDSPRDCNGHGTHTASIAAGNPISMASMVGLAEGTARGGTPSARIAVYKVCWGVNCYDSNVLAAFDDAIADGVDIISASIASTSNQTVHFRDAISIGAFHAMQRGVLTVLAAGNAGPHPSTLYNFSPWAIVVGATTLDRRFVTDVQLGDNTTYEGVSLNTFDLEGKLYPIIYSGDAPNTIAGFNRHTSKNCSTNSLDDKMVKGKIILCEANIGVPEAIRVGAIGILIQGQTNVDLAFSYPLPTSYLRWKDAIKIKKYIHSSSFPTATIRKSREVKDTLAPVVASFSSRGPNNATPEILKPDLVAPGVDIIASWSPISPISDIIGDKRKLEFNIKSGTSMSCPHVSSAAAYIKSFHPTWSPAAVRSALMTTAKQMSPENNRDAEFAYGAGQIDPVKAMNPGLIYETSEADYIKYLCGQGVNTSALQLITRDESNCFDMISARDLNYPSFSIKAPHPKHHLSGSFNRTVANVGLSMSTYRAVVTAPKGLVVSVKPDILSFTSLGERLTYVLTVDGKLKKSVESASLVWDDGEFQVRSPIIVFDERAEKDKGVRLYCINFIYIVIFNLLFYIIID
ncbi:cucumisin-like [Cicer arietinum]|uniref:Cucumisin-like n=1 Tax=Cicer arietinum TaxID=3827 RepID=A0A3Q7Y787_CICAR|nr:cucumisin-like [Cicer arietinum]